jgi:hypothetical protein
MAAEQPLVWDGVGGVGSGHCVSGSCARGGRSLHRLPDLERPGVPVDLEHLVLGPAHGLVVVIDPHEHVHVALGRMDDHGAIVEPHPHGANLVVAHVPERLVVDAGVRRIGLELLDERADLLLTAAGDARIRLEEIR